MQPTKLSYSLRATFVVLSIILAGCASNKKSDVDSRLTNNPDIEFFSESGTQACMVGAGTGVVGCLLSNSDNKAECALIAAVAGCTVGVGANAFLDYNRQKYGTEEAALNAALNDLREENARLTRLTAVNQSVINDNKIILDNLQKDIAANRVNAEAAKRNLASIDANIEFLLSSITNARTRKMEWDKLSNSQQGDTKELDKEIQVMNEKIKALETELNSLFEQRTAIRLS
ncbi:hypothetical protein [Thorsellia kenyensis]|uniref:Lipoprotein n=1 Tax=Thorsellia kenyensis TaxID=1549888 RepID=A0ABV6CB53_9GAMM